MKYFLLSECLPTQYLPGKAIGIVSAESVEKAAEKIEAKIDPRKFCRDPKLAYAVLDNGQFVLEEFPELPALPYNQESGQLEKTTK